MGPSICEKCYIVDKHVIDLVQNILEDVEILPYNLIKDGQYYLDLREVNRLFLIKAGVPWKTYHSYRIYVLVVNRNNFYSHRRDQGKTGRMISFIGWKETYL